MKAALMLVTLTAVALAGCTGGDSGPVFTVPDQDEDGNYIIETAVQGLAFTPRYAKVPLGANVTWINSGEGLHNVAALDGSFRNGDPDFSRWEYTLQFDEIGDFDYRCEPHSSNPPGPTDMWGTIRVVGSLD